MTFGEDNLIVKLTFQFSVETIKFIDSIQWGNKFALSHQLIRSSTSIGANVREAQNAESQNDFVHKFKLAAKEVDETEYWLQILNELNINTTFLINKLAEIKLIINKIIGTTKRKMNVK